MCHVRALYYALQGHQRRQLLFDKIAGRISQQFPPFNVDQLLDIISQLFYAYAML